jgi:Integrase zinc binding domain/Chromo (CHRromatin Organisation MOdifier) domain
MIVTPGITNRADGLSRRPNFAPDTHNDEPVIALPADLFTLTNTPILHLKTLSKSALSPPVHCRALTLTKPKYDNTSMDPIETDVLKAQLHDTATLHRWKNAHGISYRPGGLWWKNDALVIVGNNDLKWGVLHHFHDHIAARHPGITKTLATTGLHYWWPGMKDFITQYIKGCATCQMTKINTHLTKPALFPITTDPTALPFQVIALDFVTDLPISQGYDSILTVTDHNCSKASFLIPCNKTITAEETAELYARTIIPHNGLLTRIISDRDPRFRSKFITTLCKTFNIHQNMSTTNHPQTDGQSERTNQQMEQGLRILTSKQPRDWAKWLPIVQYTKNAWINSTTKKTPFELILGYTPVIQQPRRATHLPNLDERLKEIQRHRREAQEAISTAQKCLIKETNFKPFKVEDLVWLEQTNLPLPYESTKLAPKRYGPFPIMQKISDTTYRLKLPEHWRIHNTFHTKLLTPYKQTDKYGPNFLEPPPELLDGEPEWEIEEIMGQRQIRNKRQYLVWWKDYSPAHDSWEDESAIHAPLLIQAYQQRLKPQSA